MAHNGDTIQAVKINRDVVRVLVERDGARVTDVADEIGVAPSTAHNHLQMLLSEGFVVSEGADFYPSIKYLEIGEYARGRKPSYRKAERRVKSLAEESGGRTHFVIEEHGVGRYLHTSTGELAVETYTGTGASFPLHATAAGKAILSQLPDPRVREILDEHGLEPKTERTITDEETLFETLLECRERGVAFNIEEHNMGISAVAAPVRDPDGGVLGALTISGPAQRFKGETIREDLPDTLLATVNELELDIVYS